MSQPVDYQLCLLRAVDEFLKGTAQAEEAGLHWLKSCPKPGTYTVNDLIWGSLYSMLGDSVIYRDLASMRELRPFLAGESTEIKRGIVSNDFRWAMIPSEHDYLELLERSIALLEHFPPVDIHAYIEQYAGYQKSAETLLLDLPKVDDLGDETLFRLVLREVDAAIMHLDFDYTVKYADAFHKLQLFQGEQVGIFRSRPYERPDAMEWVNWSKKALGAVTGTQWILLTWQVQGRVLIFSLH